MKIKFTCSSSKERTQTIRTAQLSGFSYFKKGEVYKIYFSNGEYATARVNRLDGSTLSINYNEFPKNLKRASVGNPVSRTIKGFKKIK